MNLTKEKKREWIIKNCLDKKHKFIDLSGLDLRGYTVDISNMLANAIWQNNQRANTIRQENQRANDIYQSRHKAEFILQNEHKTDILYQDNQIVSKVLTTQDLSKYNKRLDRANTEYYVPKGVNDVN